MPEFKFQDLADVADRLTNFDILASTTLTLLYSLEHIEIGYSKQQRGLDMVALLEGAGGRRAAMLAAWKKIAAKKAAGEILDAIGARLDKGGALSSAERGKMADDIVTSGMLDKFSPAMLADMRAAPAGPNVRVAQKAKDDPSEIHFDTAAICVWESSILVALNYKNRLTGAVGLPSSEVSSAVARQLFALIDEDGGPRFTSVSFVNPTLASITAARVASKATVPISRLKDETPESQRAAPHAEMQLVAYLGAAGALGSAKPIAFGISKPACVPCATVLKAQGVAFTEWDDALPDARVFNWLHPTLLPLTGAVTVSR
jgi:hypothetical protein